MEKICKTCKKSKDISEFGRYKKSADKTTYSCRACINLDRKLKWAANRELNNRNRKEYRDRNKERIKEEKRREYWRHRDHILARTKIYATKNKTTKLEYGKKHYRENKHLYIANARKRENRLNEGINNYYMDRLKELYYVCEALSKHEGVKYQVDHIIPLTHPNVCGLHTPWNMQILDENENRSKKNKFDGTYENESWRG